MKKFLLVATVVKTHVNTFHIPTLKMMKEKGYEVHVASRNDYENPEECYIPYCDKHYDVPFERFPIKKNNIESYKVLKNIIESNEYEIIHCHTPVGGALTRLAARSARKKGAKVLYTAHGFHFYDGAPIINWLTFYPIEKLLSKYTDTLITINKEDYEQSQKFKAKNLKYIPGVGIDLKKYNQKNIINMAAKRKELGIKKDSFVVVSIGELNKNKNHQIVLKALSNLKDNNFDYLICGEGSEETKLRKLSVELNIQDKVHFLGFRKDINEILYLSELFVFPSYREGLSMALMEAMAMGLPAIVSDIRGNRDLIDDKKGGYLFQPDNCLELSSLINKLYTEKETRNKMSNYNLVKIKEFSIKNSLKEMEKVISEY